MTVERDDVAKLVPIADLKCVGAGGEKCDKPPTHRLVYWDAEDELFCEPHGRMWVEELMPTRLREPANG